MYHLIVKEKCSENHLLGPQHKKPLNQFGAGKKNETSTEKHEPLKKRSGFLVFFSFFSGANRIYGWNASFRVNMSDGKGENSGEIL